MIAPVAAAFQPDAPPRGGGKLAQQHGRDRLLGRAEQQRRCPLCIRPRLIAGRFEAVDAILERRIIKIGDATFDRIVEPLQAQLGFGGTAVQLRDVLAPPIAPLLPAIEHVREHVFQPVGIEQPFLKMLRDEIV